LPASIFYDEAQVNLDLTLIDKETDSKVFEILSSLLLAIKRMSKLMHRFKVCTKHAVYIIVAKRKIYYNSNFSLLQEYLYIS